MPQLFHHLLTQSALKTPSAVALQHKEQALSYLDVNQQAHLLAAQLQNSGLTPNARVAVYLPKQFESVISYFAISLAGGAFVPVNPLLKSKQVHYVLTDCQVNILITSLSRYQQLTHAQTLPSTVTSVILTDCPPDKTPANCLNWQTINKTAESKEDLDSTTNLNAYMAQLATIQAKLPSRISRDMAAILYTSGSTGNPKGVVISHQNLLAGARSVSQYLHNTASDNLLAVLPFSFDYGLSQLTTAFLVGGCVTLMEYLLPRDVIRAVARYKITGLAAVPPLWLQLVELDWPDSVHQHLRYFTNSGGAMPQTTLKKLMQKLPKTSPFLMYGLTEAFRSTYLEPTQIENRPGSIGKAIPDAEILVINQHGQPCQPGEEGELVHRGPHVAMGYWDSPEKTAIRFKPLPQTLSLGLVPEIAVWSGDTVVKDEEGYLYFVGRRDDMIKSSGYRISPSEIEECIYQFPGIAEVAAIGIAHPRLGQAVVVVVVSESSQQLVQQDLLKYCQKELPNFMHPQAIFEQTQLPRNPNGKINRQQLMTEYADVFQSSGEN
ncbi:acyl-CoA ligase (AMP-forming), exosortase A system-associated [Aliikangiella maris]|uniref:Acyl-CoA ligase (AMP-forming), exosortase A system-associated n=2 Tax=Aliikangiella maris TaxID=3162458 RepID=A0ABV3MST7_9GAMM